ncbi:sex-determining region Y protein [Hydra vulgaris]|uniref:sex-determining region Y protein n=1 Tax=Hydra vulgaris TaxID=6087 RepID=UPI0001926503|nr:sex-determining region Y protein [Hydra vulgaris]
MNFEHYANLDRNFNLEKCLPNEFLVKSQRIPAEKKYIAPKSVKRPMNAFMLWAKDRRRFLMENNPTLHNADISKILGSEWRDMPDEKKNPFWKEAHILMVQHKFDHPEYHYKPRRQRQSKTKGKQELAELENLETLMHKRKFNKEKVSFFERRVSLMKRSEEQKIQQRSNNEIDYEAMDRLNYLRYLNDKKNSCATIKSKLIMEAGFLNENSKLSNLNTMQRNQLTQRCKSDYTIKHGETEDKSLLERKRQLDFFLQVDDSDESDIDSQRTSDAKTSVILSEFYDILPRYK